MREMYRKRYVERAWSVSYSFKEFCYEKEQRKIRWWLERNVESRKGFSILELLLHVSVLVGMIQQ